MGREAFWDDSDLTVRWWYYSAVSMSSVQILLCLATHCEIFTGFKRRVFKNVLNARGELCLALIPVRGTRCFVASVNDTQVTTPSLWSLDHKGPAQPSMHIASCWIRYSVSSSSLGTIYSQTPHNQPTGASAH